MLSIYFPFHGSGRSDIYDFDGVHDLFLCHIDPGVKLDMVDRQIVHWTFVNLPAHTPPRFGLMTVPLATSFVLSLVI